ncbi:hypothetical protein K432DRAFT_330100 [Lepidopterella palustris CBS 459.81]|uniref:COP9 signalosome complex subunit 3 N-terminal helical repeats domain-containing protein n=1 Tax=Lepidopterella palustris CBS 459.81 TaxID=1314670 RepID=A0A8E2E8N1_9PEZI|nr:hypothetical protein K432DRAFT_330100 [Lepidopterella palustris CBS 459.81]
MADLLSLLFSFQPDSPDIKSKLDYDRQIRTYIDSVLRIPVPVYLKGADSAQDLLEILNPAVNTIAYCCALLARIQSCGEHPKTPKHIPDTFRPGGPLWRKLVEFLETFDPVQIRYIGQDWRRLLEYTDRVSRIMGSPGMAISAIRSAMLRLDPSTGTFTSNHLLFIRLCMEARSYPAALPILDNYIHSLPSNLPKPLLELEGSVPAADLPNSSEYISTRSGHSDKINLTDIHEYYLLGAMAYLGVAKYKQAQHFLEHILVTPAANIASGLMLEAFRKWILVSCLADGSLPSVPRTANPTAIKQMRAASKAYEALADAFQNMEIPKLRALADVGSHVWADDGNRGLVKELIDHQMRLFVSKLQRTFSAIPITTVAQMLVQPPEVTEKYLNSLISGGYLNASIEHVTSPNELVVLRFYQSISEGPLGKSEKQQHQELVEQTRQTIILADQAKAADYRLSLTKEYLEHLRRQSKKAATNLASGEAMDVSWDENVETEEDMMADLH